MEGIRYRIEGGKEVGFEEIGIPVGTTFIVNNIFFNTPARDLYKRQVQDSYGQITKVILLTITPVLFSTTIYNIGNLLDNPIYQNIMSSIFHVSGTTNSAAWGVYSGYYRLLTTMPIAIASSLSTAIVPSLVRSYIAKDKVCLLYTSDMAIEKAKEILESQL